MAKDCGCSGSRCGCKITAGSGITLSGTGTDVDPFIVTRNASFDSIAGMVVVDDSQTVVTTRLGSGTVADPYVLKSSVVIASPDGNLWTLQVDNSGAVSAVSV